MTDEKAVFQVGGQDINVIRTGIEQAEQVLAVSRWVTKFALPAVERMRNASGDVVFEDGMQMINVVLENVTTDALIEGFMAVFGVSRVVAEQHFDIALLVEAITTIYEKQPSYRRLLNRFFSTSNSAASQPQSSTPSELPTDGPTK